MREKALSAVVLAGCILSTTGLVLAEGSYPIAGVDPSQRPAGAPVIESAQKDADWYSTALTGVSKPYPSSLNFLENQGNWYTPFNRAGMTGPYDIRGWHQ